MPTVDEIRRWLGGDGELGFDCVDSVAESPDANCALCKGEGEYVVVLDGEITTRKCKCDGAMHDSLERADFWLKSDFMETFSTAYGVDGEESFVRTRKYDAIMVDGVYVDAHLKFGRHDGKRLSNLAREVDGRGYLKWMLTQDFDDLLKKIVSAYLLDKK